MIYIRKSNKIPPRQITDPAVFESRRKILKTMGSIVAAGILPDARAECVGDETVQATSALNDRLAEAVTPFGLVSKYNNYYEFSLDKSEPSRAAQALKIDPWSLEVSGEVERAKTFTLDDLMHLCPVQEYVYRLRCVEGWSAVIPWLGFSLAALLKHLNVLSMAKFVKFTSVIQPESMAYQRKASMLEWPYVEGLRIDEATHPLTLLAVGMYGERLPKQNGAPIRLVVPWKYGFKSIKAVVKIELVEQAPLTTWHRAAPNEYGFYANVNPNVPHPRWSQASERRLGTRFYTARHRTELFNGYAEEVACLYRNMDLRQYF